MVPGARDPKNRILGGWVASINNYESYKLSSVFYHTRRDARKKMWREAPLVTWYVTVGSDGLNEPFRRDLVVMKTYCRTLQYAASTISPRTFYRRDFGSPTTSRDPMDSLAVSQTMLLVD